MSMAAKILEAAQAKRVEASHAWAAFDAARASYTDAVGKGDVTIDDADAFAKLDDLGKAYDLARVEAEELEARAARAAELEGASFPTVRHPLEPAGAARPADARPKTIGEAFTNSEIYQTLRKSGALDNVDVPLGSTPAVKVADRSELKTLITSGDTSGGAFSEADRQAGVVELARRQRRVLDLITVGQTDSDVVEYVRQSSRTNAAAETAEAGATGDGSGAAPESAAAWEIVTATVRDITHYQPATKRALADGAALQTLIDQELREGALERLETQVVSGNGTAPNLRGILNTSGINTQALGTDSRSDAIHKAITLVRLDSYEPTAVLIHPSDFEDTVLEKDANGNYIYGPPSQPQRGSIWGLAPVVSPVITAGTALVGDYRRGATLWIREGLQVAASDSHSDFFIRRMIAVLATLRAAFAVQRPDAFATVTGI